MSPGTNASATAFLSQYRYPLFCPPLPLFLCVEGTRCCFSPCLGVSVVDFGFGVRFAGSPDHGGHRVYLAPPAFPLRFKLLTFALCLAVLVFLILPSASSVPPCFKGFVLLLLLVFANCQLLFAGFRSRKLQN